MTAPADPFLRVRDLCVEFPGEDGVVHAVNHLDLEVARGRTLGVVGESGSGKSVAAQAILGLFKGTRVRVDGSITVGGHDVGAASENDTRKLRGAAMAMIFQDSLSALNPFYSIGNQIAEAYLVHHPGDRKRARMRAVEILDRVGIANAARRFHDYPHELSGGMRQRAMIAMALICEPALLIADEPTTALDVTVQAQILQLIREMQADSDSAVLMITHDLGVVAESCDDVVVMYGGRCVERAPVETLFSAPEMPYTWGLLESMPRLDRDRKQRLLPIPGAPPSMIRPPPGCMFHPRCRHRDEVSSGACATAVPDLLTTPPGHSVRCHIDDRRRREIWSSEIEARL